MGISATNLIVILVIVVLLFGSKKIPELAKGVGQGIKVFKKEIENDEEKAEIKEAKAKDSNEIEVEEVKEAKV